MHPCHDALATICLWSAFFVLVKSHQAPSLFNRSLRDSAGDHASSAEHGRRLSTSMIDAGSNGCTGNSPCAKCSGDCDQHSDCASGLRCFHRDGLDPVPGCLSGGVNDITDQDYCTDVCADDSQRRRSHRYSRCKDFAAAGKCTGAISARRRHSMGEARDTCPQTCGICNSVGGGSTSGNTGSGSTTAGPTGSTSSGSSSSGRPTNPGKVSTSSSGGSTTSGPGTSGSSTGSSTATTVPASGIIESPTQATGWVQSHKHQRIFKSPDDGKEWYVLNASSDGRKITICTKAGASAPAGLTMYAHREKDTCSLTIQVDVDYRSFDQVRTDTFNAEHDTNPLLQLHDSRKGFTYLSAKADKGSTIIHVASNKGFEAGTRLTIGEEADSQPHIDHVVSTSSDIVLNIPLTRSFAVNTLVRATPALTIATDDTASLGVEAGGSNVIMFVVIVVICCCLLFALVAVWKEITREARVVESKDRYDDEAIRYADAVTAVQVQAEVPVVSQAQLTPDQKYREPQELPADAPADFITPTCGEVSPAVLQSLHKGFTQPVQAESPRQCSPNPLACCVTDGGTAV